MCREKERKRAQRRERMKAVCIWRKVKPLRRFHFSFLFVGS